MAQWIIVVRSIPGVPVRAVGPFSSEEKAQRTVTSLREKDEREFVKRGLPGMSALLFRVVKVEHLASFAATMHKGLDQ